MVEDVELIAGILDVVPQPVWVVDHPGTIVFANPAALAALGYDDASQLVGRPSHDTVHYKRPDGSAYPADQCPMIRPRITGETAHGEDEWFVRRDGSMFPIAWWSAPLERTGGRGAVLAFTDTSERREAERVARERDAANVRAAEARNAQRRVLESERAIRWQVARDLHDGAQQRLVTVLISLQLAREAIDADQDALALLDRAQQQTREAIVEVRELAAGVYPAILSDRGLAAAVRSLGDRAPFPVAVKDTTGRRFDDVVESHGYFLVAEALTNAVKYAQASTAEVTLELEHGVLSISVADDGIGGAEASSHGNGLMGLADRLSALDGALEVVSPHGGGTVVRAAIPVGVEDGGMPGTSGLPH